jgi:hypothetical protein
LEIFTIPDMKAVLALDPTASVAVQAAHRLGKAVEQVKKLK